MTPVPVPNFAQFKGDRMTPAEACAYAATWGSFIHSGDPGSVMYGFSPEDCRPQSEGHRLAVLQHCHTTCIPIIQSHPELYPKDELKQMLAFLRFIVDRPVKEANKDD